MAKIYGQLEKAQAENVTSDVASEPAGMLKYRTDETKLAVSNGTVYKKVLTEDLLNGIGAEYPEIATPASPAASQHKMYFKADGKLYTLDENGAEIEIGAGGGAGSKTYIPSDSGDIESTEGQWLDDDGIGGASTPLSAAVTSVAGEFLVGGSSLKLSKTAVNASGHFFKLQTETIDPADRGRRMYGSFEFHSILTYKASDLIVEVYDVTNAAVLYSGASADLEIPLADGKFQFFADTESTTAVIELRLKINNTDTNAFDVSVDDFKLGPAASQPGSIITEWEDFTPTWSWGGLTSSNGKKRRVGDTMEIMAMVETSASPTGGNLFLDIPDSLSIDTAKLNTLAGNDGIFGVAHLRDTGVAEKRLGYVAYKSATEVYIIAANTTSGSNDINTTITNPFTFAAGDYVWVKFSVPISGWNAGNLVSTNENLMRSATTILENQLPTGTIDATWAGNTTIFGTVSDDYAGNYNSSTGVWTAKTAGVLKCKANIRVNYTAAPAVFTAVRFINTTTSEYVYEQRALTGTTSSARFSISGNLKVSSGDTVELQTYSTGGTPVYANDANFGPCNASYIMEKDLSVFGVHGETEYVEATVTSFTTISTAAVFNMTSLPITAGDWEIAMKVDLFNNGVITESLIDIGVNETTADLTGNTYYHDKTSKRLVSTANSSRHHVNLPRFVKTVAATTTIYANAITFATSGNLQYVCKLSARRIK